MKLHVVCDNYATHKHPAVRAWLARNPRITMHFTPTSGSWLNMVEIFFGIITRQAIRRGTFTSVKDLIEPSSTFIDGWNDRCEPFIWTKTADDILNRAQPVQQLPTRDTRSCSLPAGRATRWSTTTTDRVEPRVDCYRVGALTDSFVRQATTTSQIIQRQDEDIAGQDCERVGFREALETEHPAPDLRNLTDGRS